MRTTRLGSSDRAERTILDLKTALAVTAKRHGVNKIAALYGLHPQSLYNNLNVNDPDRAPTLAQFELVLEFARDNGDQQQILDALSQLGGCIWLPLPDQGDLSEAEVFAEVTRLVAKVGALCNTVREATADGHVCADEVAMLELDLLRLMQAGFRVVESAKRFGIGRQA
ncbi:phage regulatory CII family protein [Alloalcanivorax xenomutans]